MNVGIAIWSILNADATLISVLGRDSSNNIYAYEDVAPQSISVDTYVRYYVSEIEPNDTKDGASTIDDVFVMFQIFGKSANTCRLVANAIRSALDRKAHGSYNGVTIQGVKFVGGRMLPEFADGVDRRTYELEFKFRHKR